MPERRFNSLIHQGSTRRILTATATARTARLNDDSPIAIPVRYSLDFTRSLLELQYGFLLNRKALAKDVTRFRRSEFC